VNVVGATLEKHTWRTDTRTHEQLKTDLMEKSRLAKHAYEEGHHIQWKEAKAVQI
jgi:hypothetical protein